MVAWRICHLLHGPLCNLPPTAAPPTWRSTVASGVLPRVTGVGAVNLARGTAAVVAATSAAGLSAALTFAAALGLGAIVPAKSADDPGKEEEHVFSTGRFQDLVVVKRTKIKDQLDDWLHRRRVFIRPA